jgi:hypothetical protein
VLVRPHSAPQPHDRILAKAEELQVPIAPEDIEVHKDDQRSEAWAAYSQPIELLPRYPVPVKIAFRVEAFASQPGTASAPGR